MKLRAMETKRFAAKGFRPKEDVYIHSRLHNFTMASAPGILLFPKTVKSFPHPMMPTGCSQKNRSPMKRLISTVCFSEF